MKKILICVLTFLLVGSVVFAISEANANATEPRVGDFTSFTTRDSSPLAISYYCTGRPKAKEHTAYPGISTRIICSSGKKMQVALSYLVRIRCKQPTTDENWTYTNEYKTTSRIPFPGSVDVARGHWMCSAEQLIDI